MAQKDLSEYITDFYAHLYSSKVHAPGTAEAQAECWSSVPTKVTKDSLTRDLTIKDVTEAIKALPVEKAPGHDEIPMEFYHELVDEVASTLLRTFTTMLNVGTTLAYINKGLITLIPKFGDWARLGNWRPITLLGNTYKILAKVFTKRIQSALTHIIRPNQTGLWREEAYWIMSSWHRKP
jgi:hypothetical protein